MNKILFLLLLLALPVFVSANGGGDIWFASIFLLYGLVGFVVSFGILYSIIFVIRRFIPNIVLSTFIAVFVVYGVIVALNMLKPGLIDILHEDTLIQSAIPTLMLFLIGYTITYFFSGKRFSYFSTTAFLTPIAITVVLILNLIVTPSIGFIASSTDNCNATLDRATRVDCFKKNYRNYDSREQCELIPQDFNLRYLCFTRMAKVEKDISFCQAIGTNNPGSAICRAFLAAELKDISLCEKNVGYETSDTQAACYYLVAKATNNQSLCERIDSGIYYSSPDFSVAYEYEEAPLLSAYEASKFQKSEPIRDICYSGVQK